MTLGSGKAMMVGLGMSVSARTYAESDKVLCTIGLSIFFLPCLIHFSVLGIQGCAVSLAFSSFTSSLVCSFLPQHFRCLLPILMLCFQSCFAFRKKQPRASHAPTQSRISVVRLHLALLSANIPSLLPSPTQDICPPHISTTTQSHNSAARPRVLIVVEPLRTSSLAAFVVILQPHSCFPDRWKARGEGGREVSSLLYGRWVVRPSFLFVWRVWLWLTAFLVVMVFSPFEMYVSIYILVVYFYRSRASSYQKFNYDELAYESD